MKQTVLGFFLFLAFPLILSAFIINGGPENIHHTYAISVEIEQPHCRKMEMNEPSVEIKQPYYRKTAINEPLVDNSPNRENPREEIQETLRQCLDLAQDAYNTDIDDLNNLRLPIPVGDETKTKNMFRLELQESEENCRRAASNAEESLS